MPTVIDKLIVELGLDPANFDKGAKDSAANLLRFKKDSESTAKSIERLGVQIAETYRHAQNVVLGAFAAFVGGRGVKDFTSWQVSTSANVSRMSRMFGTNVVELSKWRGAAEAAGGSAEGMQESIGGLVGEFQKFSLTGESGVIPYFRALGVDIATASGEMRPFNHILLDLADRFQKLGGPRARAFGQSLGLDDGTINLLLKGRIAVEALIKEQDKLSKVTEADARAAEEAQMAWRKMEQAATSLGRSIITYLGPAVTGILTDLREALSLGGKAGEELDRINKRREGKKQPTYEQLNPNAPQGLLDSISAWYNNKQNTAMENAPKDVVQNFLKSISAGESSGANAYRQLYGGKTFSDMSQHPNSPQPITSGPNAGKFSTAAGKYQMLHSTWEEARKALNLPDFSEGSQDKAAWWLAQRDYRSRTGRELLKDLESNSPMDRARIGTALSKTWTSLPGGIEQTQSASAFARSLQLNSAKQATLDGKGGAASSNSNSTEVKIGQVTVNTQAKDAKEMANGFVTAVEGSYAVHAQSGPN